MRYIINKMNEAKVDDTNDSIVVVGSLGMDNTLTLGAEMMSSNIRTVRQDGDTFTNHHSGSNSNSNSNSVMTLNVENERLYFDSELKKLRTQLDQTKRDNLNLRKQLDDAKRRNANEEFVDIKDYALVEKIEFSLNETNNIYTDETKFKPAFEYLIKCLWGIIATEYNEKNLAAIQSIKENLLLKLDKTGQLLSPDEASDKIELEFANLKRDALSLKDKVDGQNKFLKSLLENLPVSLSTTSSMGIEPEPKTEPTNDTVVQTNGYEDPEISPSTSPSESFSRHLDKILNNNPTTSAEKPTTSANEPVVEPASDQTKPDMYVYNVNGFMAVNTQPDDANVTDNDDDSKLTPANTSTTTTSHSTITSTTTPTTNDDDTKRNDLPLYQCPKCNTSIDSRLISFQVFSKHLENCDAENNLTCMFCLRSFKKEDENAYINHVNEHIN